MNNRKSYYAISLPSDEFGPRWYLTHSVYSLNCCQISSGKLPQTVFDTKEDAQNELESFRKWCPKVCAGAKIVLIGINFDLNN